MSATIKPFHLNRKTFVGVHRSIFDDKCSRKKRKNSHRTGSSYLMKCYNEAVQELIPGNAAAASRSKHYPVDLVPGLKDGDREVYVFMVQWSV